MIHGVVEENINKNLQKYEQFLYKETISGTWNTAMHQHYGFVSGASKC